MSKKTVRLMDIEELIKDRPKEEHARLHLSYVYAAQKHTGQLREDGEPYLSHPLSVSYILAQMNMDTDSIVAGMLHDTLEDTNATKEELAELFGEEITFLVDGLTKIGKMEFESKEQKQAENFRKMLISMSKDVRVVIIKLADRLHNMRTIDSLRPDKQRRIATETLNIYIPLAHRLGIALIKWEMEDLSFRVLHPDEYHDIRQKVKLNRADRQHYLDLVLKAVLIAFEENGIHNPDVEGRTKHFYSIYSKMMKKNTSFDEIYDLLALRVIVDTVSQCYAVLGIIHNLFKPIPTRFKDYIAMPKTNMYQSLHTTVMGPEGQMVEFQIRTQQMHKVAEEGIAAHWIYKDGGKYDSKTDAQLVWLRQLVEQRDADSEDIVETLTEDVLPLQIYVYTPTGDLVELPEGSTPIDFAYAIHTQVGNNCIGAKVNGRIVHLRYKLQNGERVEIHTSVAQEPRSDWLSFVKTTRAKTRIRSYLRKKDSERAISKAMDLLEREFKEHNENIKDALDNDAKLSHILDRLSLKDKEDLLKSVGFGMLTPLKVLHAYKPSILGVLEDESPTIKPTSKSYNPIYINGIDDVMMRMAKCCNPLFGDDIVGYVSTGRGIIVHKVDCNNLRDSAINEDRLVEVLWDKSRAYKAPVKFLASTINRPGLINSITAVLKDMGLNIVEYSAKGMSSDESEQRFSVEVGDAEEVTTLLNKLKQVKGIKSIKKI